MQLIQIYYGLVIAIFFGNSNLYWQSATQSLVTAQTYIILNAIVFSQLALYKQVHTYAASMNCRNINAKIYLIMYISR